jgi:hypothetical protein
VRNIVDKTATFVARNGPEFEQRIKQNEVNNPKFNFLNPGLSLQMSNHSYGMSWRWGLVVLPSPASEEIGTWVARLNPAIVFGDSF